MPKARILGRPADPAVTPEDQRAEGSAALGNAEGASAPSLKLLPEVRDGLLPGPLHGHGADLHPLGLSASLLLAGLIGSPDRTVDAINAGGTKHH